MNALAKTLSIAALATGLAAGAAAAASPAGVWIDHTGRGAVEIAECAGGLCGHVVWVKDAKNAKACRNQIIGNVKAVGPNTWDRGWIVDPDDNARYSVELKPIGEDRLRVTGYMGSKLFSETFTWKRAPADLKRCDVKEVAAPAPAAAPVAPATTTAPVEPPAPLPTAAPPAVTEPLREARVPEPPRPRIETFESATPPAAETRREAAAPAAEPAPAASEPEAQPERRTERKGGARRKSANRECTLDLPYITVKYPCDAF
jgi:uncharacterized protein (DUF2147 family)